MAGAATHRDRATWADLLAIPEEVRRHEIVDGEIVPKDATSGAHGQAHSKLSARLEHAYGRRPGGRWPGGWRFAIDVDVELEVSEIYRPDVAGWLRERLPIMPREAPIRVRPDWTCEILSTNKRNDLIKKKRVYHRCGVPHYWIIDPFEETLTVYRWGADGYIEILIADRTERVRPEPFDAIDLHVGILFGDDEPDE